MNPDMDEVHRLHSIHLQWYMYSTINCVNIAEASVHSTQWTAEARPMTGNAHRPELTSLVKQSRW